MQWGRVSNILFKVLFNHAAHEAVCKNASHDQLESEIRKVLVDMLATPSEQLQEQIKKYIGKRI